MEPNPTLQVGVTEEDYRGQIRHGFGGGFRAERGVIPIIQ